MSDAETPDSLPRQQHGGHQPGGFQLDLDEEHSKLLLVASAREAAVERSTFVGAVVSEIARISAGSASSAHETWSAVLDEIEATTTELLAQQACYRAAGAAITTPLAPSLLAFLS
ncbi:MAG: hypothetical protein ACRDV3_08115 [Acidothermaceae bacterium]